MSASIRVRETLYTIPPSPWTSVGAVWLLRVMRESPLSSSVPFLYQLLVGAGIPVAVHSNIATSVSFTVRVKLSIGMVMIGTTRDIQYKYKQPQAYGTLDTPLTMNRQDSRFIDITNKIICLAGVTRSI